MSTEKVEFLTAEVARLRTENTALQRRDHELVQYLRKKIDHLLGVVGTVPLRAEELSDTELIAFDPIGIIGDSFAQVLATLQSTNEHLRLARDEISAIYNAVGAGIVVLDRERQIISCNRRQKELFFPRKRHVIGHTCVSLLCKDKGPASGCVFAKVMTSGKMESTKEWNFNERFYDVVGMPVKDQQGQVQQVVVVYHEVTERKRGEEALCLSLAQAVEAQQNVEAIVNSVYEGLLVTDTTGKLFLANPAALKMLGRPAEEVIGQTMAELFPDNNELSLRWEMAVENDDSGLPFDFALSGGEGALARRYETRLALLYTTAGMIRGGVVTLRDVTLERELERMKSEFVSTAAHELRTPLTSILGFAELLLDTQSFTSGERREFVSLIHDKAEKLSELIDELLDISRLEAGREVLLSRRATHLEPLVETSLDFFRHSSPRHQFKLIMPDAPVVVFADPRRISQVFDNLLSNAVKYSPAGGSILVRLDPAEKKCLISVCDEGIGMSAEQVSRIFDKFYRADASNTAVQGVGLGMTIVKDLIESHGSEITVESTPGQGTTITFTLPYPAVTDL